MGFWAWVGENVGIVGVGADVVTALVLAIIAFMQWRISRDDEQSRDKAANDRKEAEAKVIDLDRERQRDAQMAIWAGRVIDMMAELEVACYPLSGGNTVDRTVFDRLEGRASALLDRGRLFFPNVKTQGTKDDEGTRIKLLDEVLRACYVARHVASSGNATPSQMRNLVWQARRRFMKLIEVEIKKSLRPVKEESRGQSVPMDPGQWIETKELKLPERR